MLQLPFEIQGNTQTLNSLSISNLNQPIQIPIHKNINNFKLLDLNFISGLGEGMTIILFLLFIFFYFKVPLDFIFDMQSPLTRRLQRRQTFDNNQNQSLYQLVCV
jgi:hypothetical protein